MLKRVVLILTKEYRNRPDAVSSLEYFKRIMKRKGIDSIWYPAEVFEKEFLIHSMESGEQDGIALQDILYVADANRVLTILQDMKCYTVALYHEGVKGILSGTQYALEGLGEIDPDFLEKVHQRYCKVPWHITETDRCFIREMGPEDLEALYELYKEPEVTRYTEALFQDREQEKQYINDYIENIYKYYGFGTWLIHRKEDGKLIGRAGFNYRPGFEEAELGFVIGYPYWRMGYAYEVCQHLLLIGREVFELEIVQALVDENNKASVALLKKLGFQYREDVVIDNRKYQRYLYGSNMGQTCNPMG